MRFVGRGAEFGLLDGEVARVEAGTARMIALVGRRQVGKSALVTQWLLRREVPYAYFQATQKTPEQEVAAFVDAVARSPLALAPVAAAGVSFDGWDALLAAVAANLEVPTVIVIDELPYLQRTDPSFLATLQAAWDRHLQDRPVLLILIGSDLSMMEQLDSYDSPLYGRLDRMVTVEPLSLAETAELLDLAPAEACDAYLVTGGFPNVVESWRPTTSRSTFVTQGTADTAEPLVTVGERMLAAEFPPEANARRVFAAIGAGERTFSRVASASGVGGNTLSRALDLLVTKRVVAVSDPVSVPARKKLTRYTVADPYLRFWLRFVGPRLDDISRGRGDLVADDIEVGWSSYAGHAVEPLVRRTIEVALPDDRFGMARHVGGYWTRANDREVDLVGVASRRPERLAFAGSIKWRAATPFDGGDAAVLERDAAAVPGTDARTLLVGVSRDGFEDVRDLDVRLTPSDLVEIWSRRARR